MYASGVFLARWSISRLNSHLPMPAAQRVSMATFGASKPAVEFLTSD